MGNMKIKGKVKNGVLQGKVQMKHEMSTYNAAKKAGKEANFITHVVAKVGERVVFEASTSQFISKDPIIKFSAKGDGINNGDKMTVTWTDLSGATQTEEGKIKVK
jgi:sulfur-oxidizing protein SoxZ